MVLMMCSHGVVAPLELLHPTSIFLLGISCLPEHSRVCFSPYCVSANRAEGGETRGPIDVKFRCVLLACWMGWQTRGWRCGRGCGGWVCVKSVVVVVVVVVGVGGGFFRSTGYVGRKGLLSASWTS